MRINTEAELQALPEGSVVVDQEGDVSQKRGDRWCSYETLPMSDHGLAKHLPGTLLVEPMKAEARAWFDAADFVDEQREDFDGDLRQVRDRMRAVAAGMLS